MGLFTLVLHVHLMATNLKIFLVAGEESGDIHGSNLIRQLKRLADFSLYGTGGERLKSLDQKQYFDINQMTIIGISEVFSQLFFILNMFKTLKKRLLEVSPDLVILVDYPGFNLRFARFAHERGFKVVYFIAPQIWAWHYSRIEKIKRYVDFVLCILPFEEKIFKSEGVNARYIGNPIVDNIHIKINSKDEFYNINSLKTDKKTIGILPGSRKREIEALMPEILKAYVKLNDNFNFILPVASNLKVDEVLKFTQNTEIKVVQNSNYDVMKYADMLWICSGTATLEAAILQTPMVILYKVGKLTELIGKIFIKTKFIGLPNIVAGEEVVVELIQSRMNSDEIIENTSKVFKDYSVIKSKLSCISKNFLGVNPSLGAAKEIYSQFIKTNI